jgi:hypothetical protein
LYTVLLVVAVVILATGASIVQYHHAFAVFLNDGAPTGCGGG